MRICVLLLAVILLPYSAMAVDEETRNSPEFKAMMEKGKALYMQRCMSCHWIDGKGLVPGAAQRMAPPLTNADWLSDDDRIIRIVLHGLVGEIKVGDVTMENGVMVKYGNSIPMEDKEVAQVLSFIRNNAEWGNNGRLVSPRRVARVREATEGRNTPYSVKELLKAHPLEEE